MLGTLDNNWKIEGKHAKGRQQLTYVNSPNSYTSPKHYKKFKSFIAQQMRGGKLSGSDKTPDDDEIYNLNDKYMHFAWISNKQEYEFIPTHLLHNNEGVKLQETVLGIF